MLLSTAGAVNPAAKKQGLRIAASFERTAYSRIKRNPSTRELDTLYISTNDKLQFARGVARKTQTRFGLLLLLHAWALVACNG